MNEKQTEILDTLGAMTAPEVGEVRKELEQKLLGGSPPPTGAAVPAVPKDPVAAGGAAKPLE